jgi:hypothetical protein
MSIPGFTAEASLAKTIGHFPTGYVINSAQMSNAIYAAVPVGQDFPNQKCTCKKCGTNGGDVTGQCASVCKDKTVYDKGSESYDYCKAAVRVRPRWAWQGSSGWTTFETL